MIYLFVLGLLIVLSLHYDVQGNKKGRYSWYNFILIILILIAGFRWRLGSDTVSYLDYFYHETPRLSEIDDNYLKFGDKPLWRLLNSLIYTVAGRFYILQIIHAIFVNVLIFKYIKKHCKYIFLCVFFYCFWPFLGYNMEIMKASMSIVVCLYANDYAFDRKWIKAYLLYFVAILFHPEASFLLLTPLFLRLKFDRRMLIIGLIAFLLGYTLQHFIETYLDLIYFVSDEAISEKATDYVENQNYISQRQSLIHQLVSIFSIILYLIFSSLYIRRNTNDKQYERIEPFIIIGFCCLLLQLNVQVFSRIVGHYTIYFILLLTYTFENIIDSKPLRLRNSLYIQTFLLFLPLLMSIHVSRLQKMTRFYPYYSIFELKVDSKREEIYSLSYHAAPYTNEY